MSLLQRHKTTLLIGVVAVLLVLWIASGMLLREPPAIPDRAGPEPMTVAVAMSQADTVQRRLNLQGEVQPDRVVIVRAETAGRIAEVPVELGGTVAPDQVIARLAMDDREARLRRAEAAVRGRESEYQAEQQLGREGFQAQLRIEAALAELEAARADLEAIQLEIANTRIRAPIAGVLNRRLAEVGDYLPVGGEVAEILENNPLRAVVQVPQHSVHLVRVGGTARVYFLDGEVREGTIRYVSARADAATRTFRVEVRVDNPDRSLPSGISTRVEIPVETVEAHRISPALVALDEHGRLGVKAVDEGDQVVFHPIEPVRADTDALWVTGLPQEARVITVGQGFVNPGERVRVVNEAPGGRP
jgi:membrane fusion protein, multidrug efflux system